MRRPLIDKLVGATLLLCVGWGQYGLAEDELIDGDARFVQCAAFAVQLVLQEFKKKESIADLHIELMPDDKSLPSMLDIKNLLRSRGVSVIAKYLKPGTGIDNRVCAIVHLPNVSSVGHFAVVMPNTYDPTSGTYEVAIDRGFSRRLRIEELDASAEVLIASGSQSHEDVMPPTTLRRAWQIAMFTSICLAVGTVLLTFFRKG